MLLGILALNCHWSPTDLLDLTLDDIKYWLSAIEKASPKQ